MNFQEPFDRVSSRDGAASDDPRAARLASLAPAPADIDPALTFYRAGLAAAEARHESRRAWLRVVAACLMATVTAGTVGYLIGRDRAGVSSRTHLAREDAPRDAPTPTDMAATPPHAGQRSGTDTAAGGPPTTAAVATAEAQPPSSSPVDARLPEEPSRELMTAEDLTSRSNSLSTRLTEWLLGDSITAATRRPRDVWNRAAGIHDPRTLEILVRFDVPPHVPEPVGEPPSDHALTHPQKRTSPPTRTQLLEELLN